jgi:pentatricopeptide repeat protein
MAFLACKFSLSTVPDSPLSWNKNIKEQVLKGNARKAILTYTNMQELGCRADNYTFPILLKAAGDLSGSCIGFPLHGQTIKTGFCNHVFVQTSLLNMYSSLGFVGDACKVFDNMPVKDVVAWNSMLDAYVSSSQMGAAVELFDSMPLKDLTSFNIMVSGYASMGRTASARIIFDKIPAKDAVSWNSMILAYTNAGDMVEAHRLFKGMPAKNVITWNTMVRGYIRNQLYAEAVDLFDEMQAGNVKPDFVTMVAVLSGCAYLGSLERGTKIHIYAKDHCLEYASPHVTTALIVMYAKCGSILNALQVFFKSQVKDIYCWNAIISGLALHGYGYAALKLFDKMRESCIRPDDITFIGLLSACSHAGLVEDGCRLFDCIEKDFGITPKIEHYGCMVDLLSRAKLLDRAFQLIQAMPYEPGESILGALLSACVTHRDLDTGEKVMKLYFGRACQFSDGEFMMFANLYASCGKWEEAKTWRDKMNGSSIAKTAGCSMIEVNGRFHKFLAGENGID